MITVGSFWGSGNGRTETKLNFYNVHSSCTESLMDRTWTTKADVWSYGVLVWEIMSLGQQPYPARTNHEVLQFLKDGGRLEKPDKCPDDMYVGKRGKVRFCTFVVSR